MRYLVIDDIEAHLRVGYEDIIDQLIARHPRMTEDGFRLQTIVSSDSMHGDRLEVLVNKYMAQTWDSLGAHDELTSKTVHHLISRQTATQDLIWHTVFQMHKSMQEGPLVNSPYQSDMRDDSSYFENSDDDCIAEYSRFGVRLSDEERFNRKRKRTTYHWTNCDKFKKISVGKECDAFQKQVKRAFLRGKRICHQLLSMQKLPNCYYLEKAKYDATNNFSANVSQGGKASASPCRWVTVRVPGTK